MGGRLPSPLRMQGRAVFREGGRGTGAAVGASGGIMWSVGVGDFPVHVSSKHGEGRGLAHIAVGNSRGQSGTHRIQDPPCAEDYADGKRCTCVLFNRHADMDSLAPAWGRRHPEELFGTVSLPRKVRRLVENAKGLNATMPRTIGVSSGLDRDGYAAALAHWQSSCFLGPRAEGQKFGFGVGAVLVSPAGGEDPDVLLDSRSETYAVSRETVENSLSEDGSDGEGGASGSPSEYFGCGPTCPVLKDSLADRLPFEVLEETGEADLLFDLIREDINRTRVEDPAVGSTIAALHLDGDRFGAFHFICPVGDRCHQLALYRAIWNEENEDGENNDLRLNAKPKLALEMIGPVKVAPSISGLAQRIHRVSLHASCGKLSKRPNQKKQSIALAAAQGGHTTSVYLAGDAGLQDAVAVKHSSRPTGLAWNTHPGFCTQDASASEFAVPCEDGSLKIISWNSGSNGARSIDLLEPNACGMRSSAESRWSACEWGIHPRSLLRCTPGRVELMDLRSDRRRSPVLLWQLNRPSKDREILAFARPQDSSESSSLAHLFAVSTVNRVCVFDQRFAKHPLVDWEHGFEHFRCQKSKDPLPFLPRYLSFSSISDSLQPVAARDDLAGLLVASCYTYGSPVKLFEFCRVSHDGERLRQQSNYSGTPASASMKTLFSGVLQGSLDKDKFDLHSALFYEPESSSFEGDDTRASGRPRMWERRNSLLCADLPSAWLPCASKIAGHQARSYLQPTGYGLIFSPSAMNSNGATFLYGSIAGDVFAENVSVMHFRKESSSNSELAVANQDQPEASALGSGDGTPNGVEGFRCRSCSDILSLRQFLDGEDPGKDTIPLGPVAKVPEIPRFRDDGAVSQAVTNKTRAQAAKLRFRRERDIQRRGDLSALSDGETYSRTDDRDTSGGSVPGIPIHALPDIRWLMHRYDNHELFEGATKGRANEFSSLENKSSQFETTRAQRETRPRRVIMGADGEEIDIGGASSFSQPSPAVGTLDLSQAPSEAPRKPVLLRKVDEKKRYRKSFGSNSLGRGF